MTEMVDGPGRTREDSPAHKHEDTGEVAVHLSLSVQPVNSACPFRLTKNDIPLLRPGKLFSVGCGVCVCVLGVYVCWVCVCASVCVCVCVCVCVLSLIHI